MSEDHLEKSTTRRRLNPLPEAWKQLGVCNTTGYALVKNGKLKMLKLGRRSFVLQEHIDEFIASLPTYQP